MARPDSKWYKLDSAGILYSALQKEEYSSLPNTCARPAWTFPRETACSI